MWRYNTYITRYLYIPIWRGEKYINSGVYKGICGGSTCTRWINLFAGICVIGAHLKICQHHLVIDSSRHDLRNSLRCIYLQCCKCLNVTRQRRKISYNVADLVRIYMPKTRSKEYTARTGLPCLQTTRPYELTDSPFGNDVNIFYTIKIVKIKKILVYQKLTTIYFCLS